MNPRSRTRPGSLTLVLAIVAILGCARGPCVAIIAPDGRTRATVRVEVADTNSKREIGLMYRKSMDADAGMIFIFKSPSNLRFWMHNTELPLDMIFADASLRVVGIVANAQPFSETLLGVESDSQYVLEVNAGFCARHGIKAGDRLDFLGFANRAID
ncbi:MAG: DUF192 domain-containing protein [Candidatus Binatus sp.]|uniref:DUF192 domain-containing protein n=1 Tax=Candidatus Binatus sp. TaxID=2811406 RepID=UPI002718D51C|nr:DUF192 domain-containing protein [Candidatus Binatus sp.]MDO8431491.1 DUF192 domain-containing protein [Candidatus Binatus sp.]